MLNRLARRSYLSAASLINDGVGTRMVGEATRRRISRRNATDTESKTIVICIKAKDQPVAVEVKR